MGWLAWVVGKGRHGWQHGWHGVEEREERKLGTALAMHIAHRQDETETFHRLSMLNAQWACSSTDWACPMGSSTHSRDAAILGSQASPTRSWWCVESMNWSKSDVSNYKYLSLSIYMSLHRTNTILSVPPCNTSNTVTWEYVGNFLILCFDCSYWDLGRVGSMVGVRPHFVQLQEVQVPPLCQCSLGFFLRRRPNWNGSMLIRF